MYYLTDYSEALVKNLIWITGPARSGTSILGNTSNINILPLILREVSILSVNAECSSTNERKNILQTFKSIKLKRQLLKRTKVINLKEVSKIMKFKSFNKKSLRYVVKI